MRYFIILFCFSSVWLLGQDVKVTLLSSKNEVAVGEQFTVTLTANVKGSGDVKMPEGLEISARMNGSSSSSINGKQSYEASLTLTVVASRKGTFTIPKDPNICTRDWCTCAADIPLTKQKLSE